jgi:3-oxoacyl-[acyl-carrier-protein] synthase III
MSRCSSAITCIRHAVNQIQTEDGVNNVLVLLVDKALEEVRSKRTLNNSMSIFSDGACAFMVCRGAGGHFLLHSVNESTGNQLNGINTTTDFVNYLQRFSAGLKSLSRQVLEEMSLQAEDFKYFIGGNYNLSILKNYAILSGFKPKQLYYPNLKDMAHAYSSDLLITLKTLKKEDLKHGDKLFLLGTGSFHWGASVISYCN